MNSTPAPTTRPSTARTVATRQTKAEAAAAPTPAPQTARPATAAAAAAPQTARGPAKSTAVVGPATAAVVAAAAAAAPAAPAQAAPAQATTSEDLEKIAIPSLTTLQFVARYATDRDKPIMLDYYIPSMEGKAFYGESTGAEVKKNILIKSQEEFTSVIVRRIKCGDDFLIETENSIYIVSAKIRKANYPANLHDTM